MVAGLSISKRVNISFTLPVTGHNGQPTLPMQPIIASSSPKNTPSRVRVFLPCRIFSVNDSQRSEEDLDFG